MVRGKLLSPATWPVKALRSIRLAISSYPDSGALIDTARASREVKARPMRGGYKHAPDFDR